MSADSEGALEKAHFAMIVYRYKSQDVAIFAPNIKSGISIMVDFLIICTQSSGGSSQII